MRAHYSRGTPPIDVLRAREVGGKKFISHSVGALAVIASVESSLLPFSKDEVKPSLIAADGEAAADAVDVFGFPGASRASENRERAGRRRSDHGGAEHQDEKNRRGRGQGLSGGGHCKQKAVRFKQNS